MIALLLVCSIVWGCASANVNHYSLGVEHYTRGRLPEAIEEYKEAIQQDPRDLRPRFNLAVIYQDMDRNEEASKLYELILKAQPGHAPALVNLAAIKEKEGDLSGAESLFRKAVEMDKDVCFPPSQYGFFLLRRDRAEDAEAAFKEAVRRDKSCANAYFGLGSLEIRKGDSEAALRYFKEAIHYNPSDLPAHLEAVEILIARGDRSEAIRLLQKAATLDPHRAETYYLLGRLLGQERAWKDAEEALSKALSLGAPREECSIELSQIYRRLAEEALSSCSPQAPAPEKSPKGAGAANP
jgi:Flp pilus assembly protein TadD